MPRRPCLDCAALANGPRCEPCRRARRRAREVGRPTKQERGYTAEYDRRRESALASATHCATCHEPFTENNPATGGHVRAIRKGGTAADGVKPECRRCNYGWRRTGS